MCKVPAVSVVYADGLMFPLDHHGLLASLRDAARSSGVEEWWAPDDVAAAVWSYAKGEHTCPTFRHEDFEQMVRLALQNTGCWQIAETFRIAHPFQYLSLLTCAQNPPLRDEADFFLRLQSIIRNFHRLSARLLHFTDLTACEAELFSVTGLFPWSGPSVTKAKIVSFVRHQIRLLSWPHPVYCSIN